MNGMCHGYLHVVNAELSTTAGVAVDSRTNSVYGVFARRGAATEGRGLMAAGSRVDDAVGDGKVGRAHAAGCAHRVAAVADAA